jgi:hypothetical protein
MLERIRKFALLTTMEREKYSASRTNTHAWLRARTCSHDSCAHAHGQTDARVQYSLHKPTLFSCSDTIGCQLKPTVSCAACRCACACHRTARHGTALFLSACSHALDLAFSVRTRRVWRAGDGHRGSACTATHCAVDSLHRPTQSCSPSQQTVEAQDPPAAPPRRFRPKSVVTVQCAGVFVVLCRVGADGWECTRRPCSTRTNRDGASAAGRLRSHQR